MILSRHLNLSKQYRCSSDVVKLQISIVLMQWSRLEWSIIVEKIRHNRALVCLATRFDNGIKIASFKGCLDGDDLGQKFH